MKQPKWNNIKKVIQWLINIIKYARLCEYVWFSLSLSVSRLAAYFSLLVKIHFLRPKIKQPNFKMFFFSNGNLTYVKWLISWIFFLDRCFETITYKIQFEIRFVLSELKFIHKHHQDFVMRASFVFLFVNNNWQTVFKQYSNDGLVM